MKTLKTLMFLAIVGFCSLCSLSSYADGKTNLMYNDEEVDGQLVGQTVYREEGGLLTPHLRHAYTYDEQGRVAAIETQRWDQVGQQWQPEVLMQHSYEGRSVTTDYFRWDKRQAAYLYVPSMTVSMDYIGE